MAEIKENIAIFQTTGKRKKSVARLTLIANSEKKSISINGKDINEVPKWSVYKSYFLKPLIETGNEDKFMIKINAKGGGYKGQIDSTRIAIARALLKISPDYRTTLKVNGWLTRDDRIKWKKIFGRPKARKKWQYAKR